MYFQGDRITMVWKDIDGFSGEYQVSDEGQVRSVDRIVHYSNGGERFYAGRILKQKVDRCGYLYVGLRRQSQKQKFLKVHRLVAQAFIDNPLNKPQVNHKNEDKKDNRASNLEWVTPKENINYGTGNARRRGNNLNQRATSKRVALIKQGEKLEFPSLASAARYLNCTTSTISSALHKRGRSKKARGYEVKECISVQGD